MQRSVLAGALALAALCPVVALAEPDLSGAVPILDEDFSDGLNRFDGNKGLWSTLPRRGQLMTNAEETVFLDYGVLGEAVDAVLPPVHALTDQGLALRTVALPDSVLPEVRRFMESTGQGKQAPDILYATGQISTAQTWAQTYGYFEIEARIPRGQGRWPAFWLTFAGIGWPPEIDVFEAYGAGFDTATKKDNVFNTAVMFDVLDSDQQPTHDVAIENPYAETPEGRKASTKMRGKVEVHTFAQRHNAARKLDAAIYDDFYTYAALWTPETVTFYFGKDRASLVEIFRVPTPEDANDPMFIIANDQFTARGGILPADPAELDRVLDPENAFVIRRITVLALPPEPEIRMAEGKNPHDPRGTMIFDTPDNDRISPGEGFDIIALSGGADRVLLTRGRENKIVSGFGTDDQLVLDGFPFADGKDAMSRLTQVGADVWLPSGADPAWPQTVIFRDTKVADFSATQFQVRWPVGLDIWAANAARGNAPETDSDGDGQLTSDQNGGWLNDKGKPVAMTGTAGPDRFVVSNPKTTVIEMADRGVDTLIAAVDYTLPPHIERGIGRGVGITLQGGDADDRLEADGIRIRLQGNGGDDLYVIAPGSRAATIRIGNGDGHDRLRGFGTGHAVEFTDDLLSSRASWTLTDESDGVLLTLGPDQSLLIEDQTRDAVAAQLGLQ